MHILYGCMFKVIIMNKRLKCCFIILVLVLNMVFSKQGFGEETKELKESELSAKSAVLIDGKTGRVLFGKNYNNKMAMASTTKIMTCIVALENASSDEVVEISKRAASMPKVHMNAIKGEKYKIFILFVIKQSKLLRFGRKYDIIYSVWSGRVRAFNDTEKKF